MEVKKCIVPKCELSAHVRGLCPTCYNAIRHLIKMELIDVDDWQEKGLILPKTNPGRKKADKSESLSASSSAGKFGFMSDKEYDEIIASYVQANGKITTWDQYNEALGTNLCRRSKKHIDMATTYFSKIEQTLQEQKSVEPEHDQQTPPWE